MKILQVLTYYRPHTSGLTIYVERLSRALVARGQVEMMTGGYYEPILPMIPDADKLGQIQGKGAHTTAYI